LDIHLLKKAIRKEFTEIFGKVEAYVARKALEEISRVLVYPRIEELPELPGVSTSGILQRIVENPVLFNPRFTAIVFCFQLARYGVFQRAHKS
jgi:hypothetical protein